jgi:hypothetical protein
MAGEVMTVSMAKMGMTFSLVRGTTTIFMADQVMIS